MKKGLLKKITALSMVAIMSLGFVGCGDSDKKEEKEEKKEPAVEFSEEVSFDEATGEFTYLGVGGTVPEGYTYSEDMTAAQTVSFLYQSEDMSVVNALVVNIDYKNQVAEADAIDQFDTQIKAVYGDQCTSKEVTYNGNKCTEWDIADPNGAYGGRSAVICDGEMLIYVEFVTVGDDASDYEAFMNTVVY